MSLFATLSVLSSVVPVSFATPHVNYVAILPELILIGGALVLLVSGQLVFAKVRTAFYSVGSGAIGMAALVASLVIWHDVQAWGRSRPSWTPWRSTASPSRSWCSCRAS